MSDLITVEGIRVSQSGYDAAPEPINCPGHDDGTDCEDDEQNPCKACFLYDEKADESRYWWNEPPLSHDERARIADAMVEAWEAGDGGANKCIDCCLVPDCDSCGPCDDHDEIGEAKAARDWMRYCT